jgi:hypothetical protein
MSLLTQRIHEVAEDRNGVGIVRAVHLATERERFIGQANGIVQRAEGEIRVGKVAYRRDVLVTGGIQRLCIEGRRTRQRFVKQDAERMDVTARVDIDPDLVVARPVWSPAPEVKSSDYAGATRRRTKRR